MEIKREALNVVIIALLFLSVTLISPRAYPSNGEFLSAIGARGAISSGAGSAFDSVTAWLYSSFAGGFTPQGMIGFLAGLSVACGAIGAVSFYFALRNYGFFENPSLFAGILFATSPAALFAFMPNYYSQYTVALSLCSLGLALFSLGKKSRAFFAAGWILFLLSGIISPEFSLFGIGLSLALAGEAWKRYSREKKPAVFALPLALLLPSIAIAGMGQLGFSNLDSSLFDLKFAIPLGAACLAGIARNFERDGDAFFAGLFALGFIVSFSSSYAALPMIAFSAGAGMEWLFSEQKKERNERAAAYLALFFFLPLSFAGFSDPVYSIVLSATFAALMGALSYVYRFNVKWLPVFAACLLVLYSVAGGIVLSGASAGGYALHSGGRELGSISKSEYGAYEWIGKNAPPGAKIAVVWDGPAARFISGRDVDEGNKKFVKFLAGNESAGALKAEGFDYVVVSSGIFDYAQRFRDISGGSFRVESFSFYANVTNSQGDAMLYRSGAGNYLMRQIGSDGKFLVADSGYFDSRGAQIGIVPYSNMVMLGMKLPPDDPENRAIWVQGIYNTNVFSIFFEGVDGLETVYGNSQARVLKVS